jgi:predicted dehydrogenase
MEDNEREMRTRVALIGTGWVSTHRHLPSLRACGGAEVVGVVDRNEARASEAASRHRIPLRSSSIDLARIEWLSGIDAVVIGTPPRTHHAIALQALSLGKHVLTEKPFAMTAAEGEELLLAAGRANRTLAVVHNFQFSRSFLRLRADLESGRLGSVRAIEAWQWSSPARRLPAWYDDLPGGLFFDESPHLLYLLRSLAGGSLHLSQAHAAPSRSGGRTPDTLTAFFDTASRVPARMTLNFVAPVSEWYVAVLGSRAVGIADVFRNVYLRLPSDGLHRLGGVLRTSLLSTARHWIGQVRPGVEFVLGRAMYGNVEVMRRFTAACVSGTPPEAISKEDGLDVLRLQHAILEAAGI